MNYQDLYCSLTSKPKGLIASSPVSDEEKDWVKISTVNLFGCPRFLQGKHSTLAVILALKQFMASVCSFVSLKQIFL